MRRRTETAVTESALVLSDIVGLFQTIAGELPAGCVSLELQLESNPSTLTLKPRNEAAAQIVAIVPRNEGTVTVVAGDASYFEVPPEGHRYTDLPQLAEIESICRAVVSGKLSETVTYRGEEAVKGIGNIELDALTTVRWADLSLRKRGEKTTRTITYVPYVD